MKTLSLLVLGLFLVFAAPLLASQSSEDVVYLKSGSIIRGTIVEQVPGKSLKIKTRDGNVFVYKMEEVEKITKEESQVTSAAHPSYGRFQFSLVMGGAIYDGFYFGMGARLGTILGPGIYTGIVVVNHFADEVSVSYLGGEIGYQAWADKISITPYGSIGAVFGGGDSFFYVGPAFALHVWPNENFGIGPDIKYVYSPELDDGFGGFYLGAVYKF